MCIILKTFIEKLCSIKNSQLNDFFYRGSVTGLGNWRRSGKIVAGRAFIRWCRRYQNVEKDLAKHWKDRLGGETK